MSLIVAGPWSGLFLGKIETHLRMADLHIWSTISWVLSGNWWIWTRWQVQRAEKSWKRKQQLVWDDENVAACGCGKENAQWNTKNNIRCGSPPFNSIVADFHVRLCLLLSLSLLVVYHIFVTFRNSAEIRGLTSLCPKSFVLCVSLFQG